MASHLYTKYKFYYLKFCLEPSRKNVFVVIFQILIDHLLNFFWICQFFDLYRILVKNLLIVDLFCFNFLIFLFGLQVRLIETNLTERVHNVVSVSVFISFVIWRDLSPALDTRLKFFDTILSRDRSSISNGDDSLCQRMFVDNDFVTFTAQHVILAFSAFPHFFSFSKTFAAIVAKEPVMVLLFLFFLSLFFLLFWNYFFKNFLF